MELVKLVLGQGLRWKQIEGASGRVLDQIVQHRQVVAERFPARGGRDNDQVFPGPNALERLRLVRIEAGYASFAEHISQGRGERRRHLRPIRLPGRNPPDGRDRRVFSQGELLKTRQCNIEAIVQPGEFTQVALRFRVGKGKRQGRSPSLFIRLCYCSGFLQADQEGNAQETGLLAETRWL